MQQPLPVRGQSSRDLQHEPGPMSASRDASLLDGLAAPEEGLRLLTAFRKIASKEARARVLDLVFAEARRAGCGAPKAPVSPATSR